MQHAIFIKNGDYDFGSEEQRLTAYNVSLIGESRDGVMLHGNRDGISNPVLNLRDRTGFYLQDLTVRNDNNFGKEEKGGVAVAIYGGDKTAMKNVRMLRLPETAPISRIVKFTEPSTSSAVAAIIFTAIQISYWKIAAGTALRLHQQVLH